MRAETALACLLGVGLLSTSHAAFATSAALRSGAARPGLKHMCMKEDAAAASAAAAGPMSRRSLLGAGAGMLLGMAAPVFAGEKTTKMTGMSNAELAKAVEKDVVEGQFMVTGDLTRGLYDEGCTFTDEIDTYSLDKWIQGTQKLFKNDYSHMDLDGPVAVTDEKIEFRFKERLQFNIPLVPLKCPLTGKLVMTRGKDGLINSYRETWDDPVWKVLLSLRP